MARRPVSWIDDPTQLKQSWLRKADSKSHERAEGMAYLSLYYSRPEWADVEQAATTGDFRFFRSFGFNLLQKTCNAIRSEVCKPLEAKVVTVCGNLKQMLNGKTFNRLLAARFETERFPELAADLFLDAQLLGKGYGLWEPDLKGDLRAVRLCGLDTFTSADGTEVVTKRYMSRRKLKARFKGDEEALKAIEDADQAKPEYILGVDAYSGFDDEDLVAVYQGWVEPAGDLPGRHVMQLEHNGHVLIGEEDNWDMPVPVFVCKYDSGFRDGEARSLGRGVAPYAVWVNALAKSYHEQLAGNKTVCQHTPTTKPEFENANWTYIETDRPGQDIVITNMDAAVSKETKEALGRLDENCLSEHGVNSGMAAGEPPPAFKSGLAIQEWRKSLLSRLSGQQRQYEGMWLGGLRIAAHYFPRLYKSKKLQVRAANSDLLETIDFDSLNIAELEATWSFQVVSGLGLTNSGKLEVFGTFQEAGIFDALDVLEAMDGPDIEAKKSRVLAHRRLIQHQIDEALDYGRFVAPIDGQDYAYAAKEASNAHAAAHLRRNAEGKCLYPRNHVETLRRLMHMFIARSQPVPPLANQEPIASDFNAQVTAPPAAPALGPVTGPGPTPPLPPVPPPPAPGALPA